MKRTHPIASLLVAFTLASIAWPNGAEARPQADARSDVLLAHCIRKAAAGKPWLERTLWGLRDQEAGWVGAEIKNTNGSHDLGPLQVNTSWVPRMARLLGRPEAQIRLWLRDDACFNVDAARWIFLSALTQTGDYWRAIGTYHSPTGWRQERYARHVVVHLRRRFGQAVFSASAAP